MKDFEKLLLKVDSCLPKLGTAELIQALTQLGINTEEKPDITSSNRKLIRWVQNAYEDLMENVDKQPEDVDKQQLCKICCFLWRSLKVTIMVKEMMPILGSSKKIMPGLTNKE